MQEWRKWADKHRSDIAELGTPLGTTKKVTKGGVDNIKNEVGLARLGEVAFGDSTARFGRL